MPFYVYKTTPYIKRNDMSDITEVNTSILKPRVKRVPTEKQKEALARGRQLRHDRKRTSVPPDVQDAQDTQDTQDESQEPMSSSTDEPQDSPVRPPVRTRKSQVPLSPSTDEPEDSPVRPPVRTRKSQVRPKRTSSPSQEDSGQRPKKNRRVEEDDVLQELSQLREEVQLLKSRPKLGRPPNITKTVPARKRVTRKAPADPYAREELPRPTDDRLNYFV
jgi:hypothetical protein